MSYRVRVALKAAVWIGSLWPLGVLVRGFMTDDLGANPIEYVTRTLGLTALGTLSVLLAAKQSGHVDAIKPLLEQLRKLDFYMSTDLYHEVLKTAGEAD